MISNERPSPFSSRRPSYSAYPRAYSGPPKPRMAENVLKSGTLQVERKTFTFALKENERGRFVTVSEEARGRRNIIIIPVTGLEDFKKLLEEVSQGAATAAPAEPPTPNPLG